MPEPDITTDPAAMLGELAAIRTRAEQLLHGLNATQLRRRPDNGGWSISECIVHLNMTAADYIPLLEDAITKGKQDKTHAKPPFSPGVLGRFIVKSMEPPAKRRFKAPEKIAHPAGVDDPAQLKADFMKVQDQLKRLIELSDGLDLEKLAIRSPYLKLLRLRLCAAFALLLAHERRHLWQAENVKRESAAIAQPA